MAEPTIRVSYKALEVIPDEHRLTMHQMYEDNDLPGAERAEQIIAFIEQEKPGTFVAILANDSVSPPCVSDKWHYHCDFYAPRWYTVLVSADIWKQYEDAVYAKNREHHAAHSCRVIEA